MNITREQAIENTESGNSYFSGFASGDNGVNGVNGAWVMTNTKHARTDRHWISDDEPLVGCRDCGSLVEPEEDTVGCGSHCPNCASTL